MMMAGVRLDVTSRLKADYADKLRLVAADPVASALFFHATIDAVVSCLLRFGATDGDGGVLGKVKGYVGITRGATSTDSPLPPARVGFRLQRLCQFS